MNHTKLVRLRFVLILTVASAVGVAAQSRPQTVAERSGFTATSRHADVLTFIEQLQQSSPNIRVEHIATTGEGRPLPMMILGDPVPTSPVDLHGDDRAVVYFQANIHAGEVEGKEALQMLARDILQGQTRDYFDRLVILVTPNFNPDGNERISERNRPRQRGPAGGVGIRTNAQNLDLNRDGVKLETPEVRGLVRNVLVRWDPVFFLDSHTHNGSYHQEPVTWTWGLNPNGDTRLLEFMAGTMLPAITRRMKDEHDTWTIPHGDFVDARDPQKGWVSLGPQPRYLSNYVGLRNRLSVLNEQYPYADFETRVRGAYDLFVSFLDELHERRDAVVAMVAAADRQTIARGRGSQEDGFIVEYAQEPIAQRLTIRGWEMEPVGDSGRGSVRPTSREATFSDVPYLARFTAQRTVRRPPGYLIAVPDPEVLDNLLAHGIAVDRLTKDVSLRVEAFKVIEVAPAERLNQGHWLSAVTGSYAVVEREFTAGTLFVDTAQALGSLAAYLLEPESDDGLVVWNRFDRYLAAQWSREPQTYPVYKLLERANLPAERVQRR